MLTYSSLILGTDLVLKVSIVNEAKNIPPPGNSKQTSKATLSPRLPRRGQLCGSILDRLLLCRLQVLRSFPEVNARFSQYVFIGCTLIGLNVQQSLNQ